MSFEDLGKKLAQLGQDTKNSVQKMSEAYQINSKISEEKKLLNELLVKVGETVIDKFGDEPLEGLEEQFAAVKKAKEVLRSLEEQLNKLKGITVCPECGKESARGEKFCSACGSKLPEEPEDAEDLEAKLREDARAAGNEVGDALNDAADKAKTFFESMADKAEAFMSGVDSRLNKEETGAKEETPEENAAADKEAADENGEAAQAQEQAPETEDGDDSTKAEA